MSQSDSYDLGSCLKDHQGVNGSLDEATREILQAQQAYVTVRLRHRIPRDQRNQFWNFITDSSRLNKVLGLAPAEFFEDEGLRHGLTRYGAFPWRNKKFIGGIWVRWKEPTWEWAANDFLICRKIFYKCPLDRVWVLFHLKDDGDFTDVYGTYVMSVRSKLVYPLVPFFRRQLKSGWSAALEIFEQRRTQGDISWSNPSEIQRWFSSPSKSNMEGTKAVQTAVSSLSKKGFHSQDLEKLSKWILHAPDDQVERMRLREIARRLGVTPEATLSAGAELTKLGVLKLRWDVLCPHCRGSRLSVEAIDTIPQQFSCAVCDIDFSTRSEERIEIVFSPAKFIRDPAVKLYCAADVFSKSHIVLQAHIPKATKREFNFHLRPGLYQVRNREKFSPVMIEVTSETAPSHLELVFSGKTSAQETFRVSQNLNLKIENLLESPLTLSFETLAWDMDILRPHVILGRRDYRGFFDKQALAANVALEVGQQTILFTDIVGSTQMYKDLGDFEAFKRVKEHFELIFSIVERNGGVIVKTIGDSVMAAFSQSNDALTCAWLVHHAMKEARLGFDVRVSLHRGACLAVNLNRGLDYFGNAVNHAAKLQAKAGAYQVAVSSSLWSEPGFEGTAAKLGFKKSAHEQGVTLEVFAERRVQDSA